MPEIMALSCPVCAAPLQSDDAERCSYCGSIVFIKPDLPRLNKINLNTSVIHEHIALFRQRVRASNFDEEAHYGLGVAYYNLGLNDAAIDELTKAANLMPENPDIRFQLATVFYESDDPSHKALAKSQLRDILTLTPGHGDSIKMMAYTLLNEGDIEGAGRFADQLPSGNRELVAQIQGRIATTHLFENRYDEARNILTRLPEDVTRQSLIKYIDDFRTPLKLVSIEDVKKPVGCAAVGVGVFLLLCLLSSFTGQEGFSVGVFSVASVLIVGFAIRIQRRLASYKRMTTDSTYIIPAMDVVTTSSTDSLYRMAEGLVRNQLGEVVTPERKAELMAMQSYQTGDSQKPPGLASTLVKEWIRSR